MKRINSFWPIGVENSCLLSLKAHFRRCVFQETDYIMSYFDNGEGFGGDSDDNMDEATYWKECDQSLIYFLCAENSLLD